MDIKEFEEKMNSGLKDLNISLSKVQTKQFYNYMNILIEWNNKINLTAIIEPEEIICKHFVDSLTVIEKIKGDAKIIDVGTGAGFPGIPIKIVLPNVKVVLLDSLNKRINFLNEVIEKLNLEKIETVHGRAEDYGRNKNFREKFDYSIARAVAPLNILTEYLMPFVKEYGKCICMKGPNAIQEIESSKNAIKILGGNEIVNEEIIIQNTDIKRNIIVINKERKTELKYPRKAGVPSKNPL